MAGVDANYTPPGGQMGSSDAQQMLQNFWPETLDDIRNLQSVSVDNETLDDIRNLQSVSVDNEILL